MYDEAPSNFQTVYIAKKTRYKELEYIPISNSGLFTSKIALGMWQGFSDYERSVDAKEMLLYAFDSGINHFDLGNNYGRPPGSAEEFLGRVLKKELKPYRNEIIISSKAGYDLFPGPMGYGSSKKYLVASVNDSLKKLKADYLDIFYSHRFDSRVSLEETADALELIYKQGKALYIGISSYADEQANKLLRILDYKSIPVITNQCNFSILCNERKSSFFFSNDSKCSISSFSPLAQGLLTGKYLNDSAVINYRSSMTHEYKDPYVRSVLNKIKNLADKLGLNMYQLSMLYNLSHKEINFTVLGVSKKEHIADAIKVLRLRELDASVLEEIDSIVSNLNLSIW